MNGLPRLNALMYHDIRMKGPCTRYAFTLDEFREHLEAIERRVGVSPTVLGEGRELEGFALTFDDGYAGWLAAAEELGARRWRAFFFLITGDLGMTGKLSRGDVRRLDSMGHVVGTHTVDHCSQLSARDEAYIHRQWRESRSALEEIIGREVRSASVPGGCYSPRVARAAEAAGLTHLFTSEPVSRAWRVGGCRILGRFALERGVGSRNVAKLAAGAWTVAVRHYLVWNTKKAIKRTLRPPPRI